MNPNSLAPQQTSAKPKRWRNLPAVVGTVGTLLIIASAAICYLRMFYFRDGEGDPEAFKSTLLVGAALFLAGAATLVTAVSLHGD